MSRRKNALPDDIADRTVCITIPASRDGHPENEDVQEVINQVLSDLRRREAGGDVKVNTPIVTQLGKPKKKETHVRVVPQGSNFALENEQPGGLANPSPGARGPVFQDEFSRGPGAPDQVHLSMEGGQGKQGGQGAAGVAVWDAIAEILNPNSYSTLKTAGQGMLDLSVMAVHIQLLKNLILHEDDDFGNRDWLMGLSIISITLHVISAALLFTVATFNMNDSYKKIISDVEEGKTVHTSTLKIKGLCGSITPSSLKQINTTLFFLFLIIAILNLVITAMQH